MPALPAPTLPSVPKRLFVYTNTVFRVEYYRKRPEIYRLFCRLRHGERQHEADGAREVMSLTDQRMPAIGELSDPNSAAHPLDHVIWRALTSRNSNMAEGDHLALRYPAPIAPFAATIDTSTVSFRSLL